VRERGWVGGWVHACMRGWVGGWVGVRVRVRVCRLQAWLRSGLSGEERQREIREIRDGKQKSARRHDGWPHERAHLDSHPLPCLSPPAMRDGSKISCAHTHAGTRPRLHYRLRTLCRGAYGPGMLLGILAQPLIHDSCVLTHVCAYVGIGTKKEDTQTQDTQTRTGPERRWEQAKTRQPTRVSRHLAAGSARLSSQRLSSQQ